MQEDVTLQLAACSLYISNAMAISFPVMNKEFLCSQERVKQIDFHFSPSHVVLFMSCLPDSGNEKKLNILLLYL